jgi:signal transduction histidine kinase
MSEHRIKDLRRLKASWTVAMTLSALLLLVVINEVSYRRAKEVLDDEGNCTELRSQLYELQHRLNQMELEQRMNVNQTVSNRVPTFAQALSGLQASRNALRATLKPPLSTGPEQTEVRRNLAHHFDVLLSVLAKPSPSAAALPDGIDASQWSDPLRQTQQAADELVHQCRLSIDQAHHALGQAVSQDRIGILLSSFLTLASMFVMLRGKEQLLKAEREASMHLERARNALEKVVAQRTLKLSELATNLQDAREAERQHLARELHDEMGAMLSTAKLDVARIRTKHKDLPLEVQTRLDHLVDTLNSGIALKRQIIEELRPSTLANFGLEAALEMYLKELAGRSNLSVSYEIKPPELGERDSLTAFRIVQESLTNVIKHSNAQQVEVRVEQIGLNVVVMVRDDGDGFDLSQSTPSAYGLEGMAHRVNVPGGSFHIDTAIGRGTVIRASFPFAQDKPV